ncbi:MAG: peptidyl-prolyl cis-trans isomerase [Desulfomonilaceae bacterium]|nr:peptidyl-prolyl cis-trans isomerase [Desulfomonilaceae bacterium]
MQRNFGIFKGFLPALAVTALALCGPLSTFAGPDDKVLATIGNETVTESDLQQMANAVPERFRHLYLTPEGRQKSLDYVINIFVLAAEAKKEGMDKSPDVQRLVKFTEKDLLARLYLDKASKSIDEPTEAEANAYYEQNKAQYATPESVHLRHILVKTEKEAQDALKLLKKGQKFDDLARKISICPSKAQGGDLDWVPKGTLLGEVESVAFSMDAGQITGPVKSKFGYHVLLLEDKKPAQESSYEQVKDYIFEQLRFQRRQEHYERLADSLRKKMNVKVTASPTEPPTPDASPAKPSGPTAGPKN